MSVERQQGGAYQLDLFDEVPLKAPRPERPGAGSRGGGEPELGTARSSKRLRRRPSNEP